MATPTLDPMLERLTCAERRCDDLARQTKAHGQILEKVQARLTELERAPETNTQRLVRLEVRVNDHAPRISAVESEYARDIDQLQSRLGGCEVRLDRHHKRLDELEAAAESTSDEPTGFERYTDRQLLDAMTTACEALGPSEDLLREAANRRDAR